MDEALVNRLIAAMREMAEAISQNTAAQKRLGNLVEQDAREIETLRVRLSQHMERLDQAARAMHQLVDTRCHSVLDTESM